MTPVLIYIGHEEGKPKAVKSEREKPEAPRGNNQVEYAQNRYQYKKDYRSWKSYLSSLPRILCSDSLVRGLKVGDELPECRELYEMEYAAHPDEQPQWIGITKETYDESKEHLDCRIMLVPVEDELDKLEKSIKRYLNPVPVEAKREQGINPGDAFIHLPTRTWHECVGVERGLAGGGLVWYVPEGEMESKSFEAGECSTSIPAADFMCNKCGNPLVGNPNTISVVCECKPQSQGEDELTIDDYKEVFKDHKRLVRELDVIINGNNAAKQASLCDIVAQLRTLPTGQPRLFTMENMIDLAVFVYAENCDIPYDQVDRDGVVKGDVSKFLKNYMGIDLTTLK